MKTYVIILSLFFLSCSKKYNNDVENLKSNYSVNEKKIENKIKNKNTFQFSVSLVEKDNDNRPLKLKIEVRENSKHFQDILYSPGIWSAVEDSLIINQIDYFSTYSSIHEGIESYHDFIIADFNFDDLEDFAILYDIGGNSGPVYSYYFQSKKGDFNVNKDFPLNHGPFPKVINKKDKTLTIKNPLGCCKISTTVFQSKENNKWKTISSKEEEMK
ncbi:XAC2610-related protein [Chryseobacterium populi]|uniref:Lipoprotein n=1 Tax=Chryseobacterium populi TaxID=1144316 RepID=J2KSS2_9FLAO|nr:hypothetical protein [Chryseobacterium populi]EJL76058.1 hypothetical protein PMI13_00027 [Chryseobacterium populi]